VNKVVPLVSVITPLYRPNLRHLKDCLKSIGRDKELEHVLVVDGLENVGNLKKVERLAEKYGATLTVEPTRGGISRATNAGARHATGQYLLFLNQDDYLTENWLAEFVRFYADSDMVHSDTFVVTENRRVLGTFSKPEWSPVRLRANMYCAHFFAVKRKIFEQLGGLRPQYDGSQDHDLALRVSALDPLVAHIPLPLYSWRQSRTPTALDSANKLFAQTSGLAAVQEHVDAQGIDAKVVATTFPGFYRILFPPRDEPVTIVIPTAFASDNDGQTRVELAIASLAKELTSEDEIILTCGAEVPAGSPQRIAASVPARVTVLRDHEAFHFSRRANLGIAAASHEYVLLLNDDVYFTSPSVLDQLLGHARQASVGLVGALLWFPDGTVQHGGHFVKHGDVGHANFRKLSVDEGSLGSLIIDREVIGVAGAVIMQRKSVWREAGGFSELFPNNYNDVDYSFKVAWLGYTNIVANSVEGVHDESLTRDATVVRDEQNRLRRRWSWKMDSDPFSGN